MQIRTPALSAVLLAVFAPAIFASDGLTVTTVFRPGDPVPGMPGFTMAGVGGQASINNAGVVLFTASIAGDGIGLGNDNVLITGVPGDLVLMARERQPVAQLPGFIYLPYNSNSSGFTSLTVTPAGDVGFSPTIYPGSGSTVLPAAFAGPATGPWAALYQSAPAPGFDAAYAVHAVSRMVAHDGGLLAVGGRVNGPTFETVVWAGDPVAGLNTVLRSNTQAPGMAAGVMIQAIADQSVGMNAQGSITARVTLALGLGVTSNNRYVWYEGLPGQLGVLARQGDPVPGLPGAVYTGFDEYDMRMNAAGDLCFAARVAGGGTDGVLMIRDGGVLAPLVRDGDPVPGLAGVSLDRVAFNNFDLNGAGRVAFAARLAGAPADADSAVFVADPGGISMILREGDVLPGGAVAPHLENQMFFFNDRGQFVFILDGAGLFATRPDGGMLKLAAGGEYFVTDDGFAGVVGSVVPWRYDHNALAAGSGGPSVFNNEGRFILSMFFTGATGTGVFLFDIDDPCPADLAAPFGLLDLVDINTFITGFLGQDPIADLDGSGLLDLADVNIFLNSFSAGCPG